VNEWSVCDVEIVSWASCETFQPVYFICIFHMQVVSVCLQPFRRNSLLKYVSQPEITKKFTKTPYFGGSRSFNVIDVEIKQPGISSGVAPCVRQGWGSSAPSAVCGQIFIFVANSWSTRSTSVAVEAVLWTHYIKSSHKARFLNCTYLVQKVV